jgi:hypothetical protein
VYNNKQFVNSNFKFKSINLVNENKKKQINNKVSKQKVLKLKSKSNSFISKVNNKVTKINKKLVTKLALLNNKKVEAKKQDNVNVVNKKDDLKI